LVGKRFFCRFRKENNMFNTPKEILIVDDEQGFRTLVQRKLKALGYHVITAQSGEEALIALCEKQNISLVLLDVRLPLINGKNISEIMRKDFPDKKIIVISALQKEEQQFLIFDADDYYYKGEELSSLMVKINTIFHGKSQVGRLKENEKRNFKRVPVNALASCESADYTSVHGLSHFFSYTKDLSLKGGRFVVAEDINVGQHFTAALELPSNFLPLLINCEVVWAKKMDEYNLKNKNNYEVGVRFVKLDLPQDEEKLKNYFSFV